MVRDDILLHDNEQDMYEHHDGGLTLSGDNVLYQSQIQLSEADEQIERNFIYKYDIHLVTLQDIVNRKRILALDNNDKSNCRLVLMIHQN
jgi:hypothetical protein